MSGPTEGGDLVAGMNQAAEGFGWIADVLTIAAAAWTVQAMRIDDAVSRHPTEVEA